jgi:hypothetical protein
MITPSGQKVGMGNQHQKSTRGKKAAEDGSFDADGSGGQAGNLEVVARQQVSLGSNPKPKGRQRGL